MKKFSGIWYGLLSLALLGGVFYGLSRLVVAAVRTFQGLDQQVAAALIAGFASVLVATASLVGGRYFERRAQREQALRAKKTEIYERFIGGMFDVFNLGGQRDEEPDARAARIASFLADLTPQLVAWASNDVVASWSRTKRNGVKPGQSPIDVIFSLEDVLVAIRRDLGHSGRGLKKGDLLGLFVNDLDQYLPSPPEKA